MKRVVVHRLDGELLRGHTVDFLPTKDRFHLVPAEGPDRRPLDIGVAELKAVFFVKDFEGDPGRAKSNLPGPGGVPMGRKVQILFKDGEVLVGWTQGYQPGRIGFFVVPVDPKSNNERCFVVTAATREIAFP